LLFVPSGVGAALLLAVVLGAAMPAQAKARCPAPQLRFDRLGPAQWLVAGQVGEADAANRGQVSAILLVREGQRLWAVGSGPTPHFGKALACQARQQLGLAITDVISPWARPELVLGARGLAQEGAVRVWAHESVAQAMTEQCPHCVERLKARLGGAAADLGNDPVLIPRHLLQGEEGRLGPFDWWRLPRSVGRWTTVWRVRGQALWSAPGVWWGDAPPDDRDADLVMVRDSAARLWALVQRDGAQVRLVPEQGPVQGPQAARLAADYGAALLAAALAAVERGDLETDAAPALPGMPRAWANHPWHSFNWQRAWRQTEARLLAAPAD
jgi:hypothetical protein